MAGMPYPPTKTPTDCTDMHRLGGKTQPKNLCTSVKSVGGLAQANSEWFCGKNSEGCVGMAGMPYPPTKTSTDCTDFHRLGGYGIPAIPTQPPNYLPTEFTEHTETTGGEEKSVYICEIRGRISSARSFCVFCEFCGRTCANKLGVGSMEGIWRAAWVWQGCHTLLLLCIL